MTKRFDLPFEWTDSLCRQKFERLLPVYLLARNVILLAYFASAMYERPEE